MKGFLALLAVVLLGAAARAEDPTSQFEGFCQEWMHKLEAREQNNVTHIQWQTNGEGVTGDYTGYYTHEHTCIVKSGTASVPVGKITYREIRYEKHGGNVSEAEHSDPRPVETTDVTEIFRYDKGKWIY
jgi:hypothetical protein